MKNLKIRTLVKKDHQILSDSKHSPTEKQTIRNLVWIVRNIIYNERKNISREMRNYDYPNGRFGVSASSLEDLKPETGGTPIRSIIVTTYRSGSTFLGDILQAIPGSYYFFEPFVNTSISTLFESTDVNPIYNHAKKLLNCDFSNMNHYLSYARSHKSYFQHNKYLLKTCPTILSNCYFRSFLEPYCKLFPIQVMKTVRPSLKSMSSLLSNFR